MKHDRRRRAGRSGDTLDQIVEEDRLWFEENPGLQWRIRPFITGEMPPALGRNWVVVYRMTKDTHLRWSLCISDAAAEFLQHNGRLEYVHGCPMWIPSRDDSLKQ